MKLTLGERYRTLEILPKESTFETIKVVKKLNDDLPPSEKETKQYNIRTVEENGMTFTKWEDKDKTEEVEIGEMAHSIISKAIKDLEAKEKLTLRDLSLYEKFIEAKK